jgi:hypothetical protein
MQMAERGGKVDSRLLLVFAMIDEALRATKEAEDALESGDARAEVLTTAAEHAHCRVLKTICSLSDNEADLAEAAFTALENRLFPLCKVVPAGRAS